MNRSPRFLLLFLLVTALSVGLFGAMSHLSKPKRSAIEQLKQQLNTDLDSLDRLLTDRLLPLAEAAQNSNKTDSLQQVFLACRETYKRIEPLTEYYFPATSRLVNGPPLPEVEVEENKMFEPGGLQVIEELLYPEFDPANGADLVREIKKINSELGRIRTLWEATELTNAHVFDALRLQVFRIISLGISGFDTPLCQNALPEAGENFAAMQTMVRRYDDGSAEASELIKLLRDAETHCRQNPHFDRFDRAHFILTYANPLSKNLLSFGHQLGIEPFDEVRPLRTTAQTLFSANAFDADAYAQTVDARQNPAKIELGRQLFFDPILSSGSAGQGRACAGCHQPDNAFTDGQVKAKTLTGQGLIGRNTPTLINAAFQKGQFYDMRAASLEDQAFDVIHSTAEMQGSLAKSAQKLQQSAAYVRQFKAAFPQATGPIEPVQIQNALASYERTLIDFDSRFDRYFRGQKAALTDEEVQGFNIYMGKAKCGICHFVPLFNGTVPPGYTKTESEVIGVPATVQENTIDPDLGRYANTKLDPLKYSFKTPTIRNIAQTAPYMHNGVYKTLEEVIEFYNKGGGTGLGFNLQHQTLPGDKLNLNKDEKRALIAFLKAL